MLKNLENTLKKKNSKTMIKFGFVYEMTNNADLRGCYLPRP